MQLWFKCVCIYFSFFVCFVFVLRVQLVNAMDVFVCLFVCVIVGFISISLWLHHVIIEGREILICLFFWISHTLFCTKAAEFVFVFFFIIILFSSPIRYYKKKLKFLQNFFFSQYIQCFLNISVFPIFIFSLFPSIFLVIQE